MKTSEVRLLPRKVYLYMSIIESIEMLASRPGIPAKCELWRDRVVPPGLLGDVYNGKVWSDFQHVRGKPFLASPHCCGLILNVDWFQPFKHTQYSVGGIYLAIMNLPRSERFKRENLLLVGLIPGPHEPALTINSFLN